MRHHPGSRSRLEKIKDTFGILYKSRYSEYRQQNYNWIVRYFADAELIPAIPQPKKLHHGCHHNNTVNGYTLVRANTSASKAQLKQKSNS